MKIFSTTYMTANAEGMQQVDIEYERSWWDSIFLRRRIRSFERWPTGFRDKVTGEYAGTAERAAIAKVLAAHT
jgi:hypothetical protein